MLHVTSARCVACDLHMTAPGPLEHVCWRQFAALWGGCKKSRIAPLNAIIIIITSVTAPNCQCLYFQIFHQIFLWMHHQSKQNSVKGQFFYCSSCKKSLQTHIFSFTDALHLDDYFVYTCESCSWSKTAEHFLQKQCTMCATFAYADASFLEQ